MPKILTLEYSKSFSNRRQWKHNLTYNIPFTVLYSWLETTPYLREEYLMTAGHPSPESPLQLLAVSRRKKHDLGSFEEHFVKLAKRNLNFQDVNMFVTEVNTFYPPLIKKYFPRSLHQFSLHHVNKNIEILFRDFLAGFQLRNKSSNRLKLFLEKHVLLFQNQQMLNEDEQQQIEALFEFFPRLETPYCFKEAVYQLLFQTKDEAEAYARRDMILENYERNLPLIMLPAYQILKVYFEQIIGYLRIQEYARNSGQEFYISSLN
jgi:hypothetical protein